MCPSHGQAEGTAEATAGWRVRIRQKIAGQSPLQAPRWVVLMVSGLPSHRAAPLLEPEKCRAGEAAASDPVVQ
jgi:hypothetical protein